MDLVGPDRVPVEVSDGPDGVGLAVELDLVRLHHLLHRGADVAQPDVDAGLPDPGVRRLPDRRQQGVELGVERHGERAVDDAPADVRAKVQLHHVAVLEHRLVARVGRPVRCHVVQRTPRRERDAGVQAVCLDEGAHAVLEPLAELRHGRPGLGDLRGDELADAAVDLGGAADVVDKGGGVGALQGALLLAGLPPDLVFLVGLPLALREDAAGVELGDRGEIAVVFVCGSRRRRALLRGCRRRRRQRSSSSSSSISFDLFLLRRGLFLGALFLGLAQAASCGRCFIVVFAVVVVGLLNLGGKDLESRERGRG